MTEKELSKIEELAKPLVEFVRETKNHMWRFKSALNL